jgi:hypothetical protein
VAAGPARSAAVQAAGSEGWTLSTTAPADAAGAPAYIGNGYVGTRVPADGAGYAETPVATETHSPGCTPTSPTSSTAAPSLRGR